MRPALLVCGPSAGPDPDYLLMQITSAVASKYDHAVPITTSDFKKGGLPKISVIRPDKLFTSNGSIISRTMGSVNDSFLRQVIDSLKALLDQ